MSDKKITPNVLFVKTNFSISIIPRYSFRINPNTWVNGTTLSSYGCNVSDKFTIFTHGYDDFLLWVPTTVNKFLEYRGGCVIFFDYNPCIGSDNYIEAEDFFNELAAVITGRLQGMKKEGIASDNIHSFGFSYGAQLVIKAGIDFGGIGSMDGKIPSSNNVNC